MKRNLIRKLPIAVMALVAGCQSTNLVFTTYTKVGLNITAVDAQPTSLMFGYKRFEGAIIPVNPDKEPGVVAPVYAAIAITNKWLSGLRITQAFATGDAAVQLSTNSPVQLLQNE